MNFKSNEELQIASKYVTLMADWNDRYYEFECVCGKEIVGLNKSALLFNFEAHFYNCPKR